MSDKRETSNDVREVPVEVIELAVKIAVQMLEGDEAARQVKEAIDWFLEIDDESDDAPPKLMYLQLLAFVLASVVYLRHRSPGLSFETAYLSVWPEPAFETSRVALERAADTALSKVRECNITVATKGDRK